MIVVRLAPILLLIQAIGVGAGCTASLKPNTPLKDKTEGQGNIVINVCAVNCPATISQEEKEDQSANDK